MVSQQLLSLNPTTVLVVLLLRLWLLLGCDNTTGKKWGIGNYNGKPLSISLTREQGKAEYRHTRSIHYMFEYNPVLNRAKQYVVPLASARWSKSFL